MKHLLILSLFSLGVILFVFYGCGPQYVGPEPLVEDLLAEAKKLIEDGKYFDAKEKLESIRFDYPGNPHIGEIQFYIGLCYFKLKEYVVAEQEFRTIVREFPADHAFADNAMYYLCYALFNQALPARLDQEITKRAIEETDAFLETYPKSDLIGEVSNIRQRCLDRLAEKEFLSGQLYRRMGYTSSAIHYFKALEKDYPGSKWCVRGRYEWALSYYLQKNYEDAFKIADTCRMNIERLQEKEKDNLVKQAPPTFFKKLVHLFGVIPFDNRTDIKIFIDDVRDDLDKLSAKIERKRKSKASPKPQKG